MRVGDRIRFQGRNGTVVGFMPSDMVDVRMDDSNGIERRSADRLEVGSSYGRAQRNPRPGRARRNPEDEPPEERERESAQVAMTRRWSLQEQEAKAGKAKRSAERQSKEAGLRTKAAPLKDQLRKGAGLFTRPAPPVMSRDLRALHGNPIDGTVYHLILDMSLKRSKSKWITIGEVEKWFIENSDETLPRDRDQKVRKLWSVFAEFRESLEQEGWKVFSKFTGERRLGARIKGGAKIEEEFVRPPKDGFYTLGSRRFSSVVGEDPRTLENQKQYWRASYSLTAEDYVKEFFTAYVPSILDQSKMIGGLIELPASGMRQNIVDALIERCGLKPGVAEAFVVSGGVRRTRQVKKRKSEELKTVWSVTLDPNYAVLADERLRVGFGDKAADPFFSWVPSHTTASTTEERAERIIIKRDNLTPLRSQIGQLVRILPKHGMGETVIGVLLQIVEGEDESDLLVVQSYDEDKEIVEHEIDVSTIRHFYRLPSAPSAREEDALERLQTARSTIGQYRAALDGFRSLFERFASDPKNAERNIQYLEQRVKKLAASAAKTAKWLAKLKHDALTLQNAAAGQALQALDRMAFLQPLSMSIQACATLGLIAKGSDPDDLYKSTLVKESDFDKLVTYYGKRLHGSFSLAARALYGNGQLEDALAMAGGDLPQAQVIRVLQDVAPFLGVDDSAKFLAAYSIWLDVAGNLVGPLVSAKGQPDSGLLLQVDLGLLKAEAQALGGSERSIQRGSQSFKTFMTYNPLLFKFTQTFWPGSQQKLVNTPGIVSAIDRIGRYGVALRKTQEVAVSSFSVEETLDKLQAELDPTLSGLEHGRLRDPRKIVKKQEAFLGRKNFSPLFMTTWPYGANLEGALQSVQSWIEDPIGFMLHLKPLVNEAFASTKYLAPPTLQTPSQVTFEGRQIDIAEGKDAEPAIPYVLPGTAVIGGKGKKYDVYPKSVLRQLDEAKTSRKELISGVNRALSALDHLEGD